MARLPDFLTFALVLLAVSGSWAAVVRSHHQKACGSCREPIAANKSPRDQAVDVSTTVLALGEPCGVYTLSCAKGLRCMPPAQENSPLQALLQGRGLCTKGSRTNNTDKPHPPGLTPSHNGELEKAPCRKLLNAVVQGLELTIFSSSNDIYIPNCDTRGYYRKKQINDLSQVAVLLPDDFKAYTKIKVNKHSVNNVSALSDPSVWQVRRKRGENLPGHFKFREYQPQVFHNLRDRFGIQDVDYQVLLARCPLTGAGDGRRDGLLLTSYDYMLVMKQTSGEEMEKKHNILSDYHQVFSLQWTGLKAEDLAINKDIDSSSHMQKVFVSEEQKDSMLEKLSRDARCFPTGPA